VHALLQLGDLLLFEGRIEDLVNHCPVLPLIVLEVELGMAQTQTFVPVNHLLNFAQMLHVLAHIVAQFLVEQRGRFLRLLA